MCQVVNVVGGGNKCSVQLVRRYMGECKKGKGNVA